MILNLLKESLKLNEEINLQQPDIKTSDLAIYELTEYNDFNVFTLNGVENIGSAFGIHQSTWNNEMVTEHVKAFMVTRINSNECIGMFLLWRQQMQFHIRADKNVALPICFESTDNHDVNNAYYEFRDATGLVLPLYDILDKYREFTGFNPEEHIVEGQLIENRVLRGIFKEFFKLDENGNFIYPENINLNQLNLNSLETSSIVYSDFGNEDVEIHVNFYDNLTQIAPNSINTNGVQDLLFYRGDQPDLPEVFNSLPDEVKNTIIYADDEEVNQERAARALERDRQIAQNFDDEVIEIFDRVTDQDYVYDEENDGVIADLERDYARLTDAQKRLSETNGNLAIAKRSQQQAHADWFIDSAYKTFIDKINGVKNYEYDPRLNIVVPILDDRYNKLPDEVKALISDADFDDIYNAAKQTHEQAKQDYQASLIKQRENDDTMVYDNCLLFKEINNAISIVGVKTVGTVKTEIQIPAKINNLPVTRIEKNAFLYAVHIQKVFLPPTIKYIGPSAFYGSGIRVYFPSRMNLRNIQLGNNALLINGANDDRKYGYGIKTVYDLSVAGYSVYTYNYTEDHNN